MTAEADQTHNRNAGFRSGPAQVRQAALASLLLFGLIAVVSCSSAPNIDLSEPKRLLGRNDDVRIDVQIMNDHLMPGQMIQVRWDLTNQRQEPIAVADVAPRAVYDPAEGSIIIQIGSQLPPENSAFRLITIVSAERRSFSAGVRMPRPALMPWRPQCDDSPLADRQPPRILRVEVQFLADLPESGPLSGSSDGQLLEPDVSGELFHLWVEKTESVATNAVPVHWGRLRSSSEEERARREACIPLVPQ